MDREELAPRAAWMRDAVLATMATNLGGLVATTAVVVARTGSLDNIAEPTFFALCGVSLVAPLLVGPPIGLALRMLTRRLLEHPLILMFAGSPAGALAGWVHFVGLLPFVTSSGDREVFVLMALLGGALVGGLGWPLYMALTLAGRPAWRVIPVFTIMASVGIVLPIGLGLWLQ